MATRMQQRRGTAAQWTSANPTLAAGEIGFETDTGKFKIGDGSSAWSALSYFMDMSDAGIQAAIDAAVAGLVDGAPDLLNTLNELAASIGDNPDFITTINSNIDSSVTLAVGLANDYTDELRTTGIAQDISGAVTTHSSDTTNVHGIADTAELATKNYADTAVSTHNLDTTNVHGIADTANLATLTDVSSSISASEAVVEAYADNAVTLHNNDTTNVHGIADTSVLATTTDVSSAQSNAETYADNAVTVHSNDTTGVHGIADTADLATKSYADTAVSDHNSDTTNVHGIADTALLATTSDLDSHANDTTNVHGIADTSALALTADVNSALALKQDKVTGVDDTEIGYLNGVTSGIQSQLNGKASSSHTHAQSDITNLTTDLAAKAPLASPTFTGTVTAADVTISGNLTVEGTTTTVNAQDLVVSDPLIYIGEGNTANLVDLGLVSSFNDGTYQHAGIVRDSSAGKWKVFKGVTDEPTTTINFAQGSLDDLAVNNVEVAGVVFSDGTQTKEGVPSRTPIIQKTASYTLSDLTERDDLIEMGSASALTLTIPADSTLNFPIGTSIDVLQTSTGQVTIAGAGGVTVNATPGLKLRAQWSSATLFKRAANTWVVMGDLSA